MVGEDRFDATEPFSEMDDGAEVPNEMEVAPPGGCRTLKIDKGKESETSSHEI